MDYICREFFNPREDEPHLIYSELDERRREVRRVELYLGGVCVACGAERGQTGALEKQPLPQALAPLQRPGETAVRRISRQVFFEVWTQAQGQPDNLMGLFSQI